MGIRIFIDSNIAIKILFFTNFDNGLFLEMIEKYDLIVSDFVLYETKKFGISSGKLRDEANFDYLFRKTFKEVVPSISTKAKREDFNIKDPFDVQIVIDAIYADCKYILTDDNGFANLKYKNLKVLLLTKFISEIFPWFSHQFPESVVDVEQDYYNMLKDDKKSLIRIRNFGAHFKPVTNSHLIEIIKEHSPDQKHFMASLRQDIVDEIEALDIVSNLMEYSHGNTKLAYNIFINRFKKNDFDDFLLAYNSYIHNVKLKFIEKKKGVELEDKYGLLEDKEKKEIRNFDINLGRSINTEHELLKEIYTKSNYKDEFFYLFEFRKLEERFLTYIISMLIHHSSGNTRIAYNIMVNRFECSHETFVKCFYYVSYDFKKLELEKKKEEANREENKKTFSKKGEKNDSGPQR